MKKKIIITLIALVAVAASFSATVFILNHINSEPTDTQTEQSRTDGGDNAGAERENAANLQEQAEEAFQAGNSDQAIESLNEAKDAYTAAGDEGSAASIDQQIDAIQNQPEVPAQPDPSTLAPSS